MRKGIIIALLCALLMLTACGEAPTTTDVDYDSLIKTEKDASYLEGYDAGYAAARKVYQVAEAEPTVKPDVTATQKAAATPSSNAASGTPVLSVQYESFEIVKKSSYTYVYCIAALRNDGDAPGRLDDVFFDIEDLGGKLLGTIENPTQTAQVVNPGETVYIFDEYSINFDSSKIGNVIANGTLKETKLEKQDYELSDVSIQEHKSYKVKAVCRMTNNTDKPRAYSHMSALYVSTKAGSRYVVCGLSFPPKLRREAGAALRR